MADNWENTRKPVNKGNKKNDTTQVTNTNNTNNTKFSNTNTNNKPSGNIGPNNNPSGNITPNNKPSGIIVPKKENKKVIFSDLINQGVCTSCLYGSCKSHQTIDERIPENLVKYVRSPNFIRIFGEQLTQTNFNIEGNPLKYSVCKFMLNSCSNCYSGRCITMNYQSNDITLCYSKPNSNGGFFIGVHIDIIYEDKGKGFDLTVLPFNNSNINIQLEDDVKSVSSNNSREKSNDIHHKKNSYSKIANNEEIVSNTEESILISNKDESNTEELNRDESNTDELFDIKNKYSDMISKYNKLNEDFMSSKDLIKKNQDLKSELSESIEVINNLRSEKSKLYNEIMNLKKDIELLKINNKSLIYNLENNKIQIELDNIVSRQIINTHIEKYQMCNENI
jgi:predicted nuclease with TOPRIM domain